jgi:hypothetical protein
MDNEEERANISCKVKILNQYSIAGLLTTTTPASLQTLTICYQIPEYISTQLTRTVKQDNHFFLAICIL